MAVLSREKSTDFIQKREWVYFQGWAYLWEITVHNDYTVYI